MRRVMILILLLHAGLVTPQTPRRFETCISAGIGLPKIPISQYRSPISFLAGVDASFHLSRKIGINAGGYGLTTLSLGTVNNAPDNLIFDLMWVSAGVLFQLRDVMQDRSMLIGGVGLYKLDQRFDQRRDKVNTLGLNLGLSHTMRHRRTTGKLDFKWHLLFNPSDNPQILTITYGICF